MRPSTTRPGTSTSPSPSPGTSTSTRAAASLVRLLSARLGFGRLLQGRPDSASVCSTLSTRSLVRLAAGSGAGSSAGACGGDGRRNLRRVRRHCILGVWMHPITAPLAAGGFASHPSRHVSLCSNTFLLLECTASEGEGRGHQTSEGEHVRPKRSSAWLATTTGCMFCLLLPSPPLFYHPHAHTHKGSMLLFGDCCCLGIGGWPHTTVRRRLQAPEPHRPVHI